MRYRNAQMFHELCVIEPGKLIELKAIGGLFQPSHFHHDNGEEGGGNKHEQTPRDMLAQRSGFAASRAETGRRRCVRSRQVTSLYSMSSCQTSPRAASISSACFGPQLPALYSVIGTSLFAQASMIGATQRQAASTSSRRMKRTG